MKFLSAPELIKRDLEALESDIRHSGFSDPDFLENRKLKDRWAAKLRVIITNHFEVQP